MANEVPDVALRAHGASGTAIENMDEFEASEGEAQQENILKSKYGGLVPPKKNLLQRRGEEGGSNSGGKQFFDSGTYNMERQLRGEPLGDRTEEGHGDAFSSPSNGDETGKMAPAHLRVHSVDLDGKQPKSRPSRMGGQRTGGTAMSNP